MITRQLDESKLPKLDRPDMAVPDLTVRDLEPLAVGKRTMCLMLGVSENTLDRLVTEEGFPVVKLPGKNLYPVAPARQWLNERIATQGNATQGDSKGQGN